MRQPTSTKQKEIAPIGEEKTTRCIYIGLDGVWGVPWVGLGAEGVWDVWKSFRDDDINFGVCFGVGVALLSTL